MSPLDDRRRLLRVLGVVALVLALMLLLSTAARAAATPDATADVAPGHGAILAACEEQLAALAPREDHPERLAVCLEVGARARRDGAPLDLALALAWEESRYQRTPRRMLGAMQVSSGTLREMCAGVEHCGPIRAGVLKLAELVERYDGDRRRSVCRYNAGGGVCAAGWVSAVLDTAERFAGVLEGGPKRKPRVEGQSAPLRRNDRRRNVPVTEAADAP